MTESAYVVRRATVDDAGTVGRLLHDFNTEFETPTPGIDVLTRRLSTLLDVPSMFALLAETSDRAAVGMALVTSRPSVWYEGRVASLDELYVVPDLRGRGIGGLMMAELLSIAKSTGLDSIEINVDEADVDAQRFYERHGYSSAEPDTGERAFYYFLELSDH